MVKKNILFFIPELGGGGAERSIILLANKLKNTFNVHICTFIESPTPFNNEVQVHILGNPPKNTTLFTKLFLWIKRWNNLKALKKELGINTTISFLEGANYLNAITRNKNRTILSVRGSKKHDGQISGFNGFIRKKLLIPILFNRSHLVVAVSNGIKEELVYNFNIEKSKIKVLPNFYEIEEIGKKSKALLSDYERQVYTNNKTIIHSGRFHKQKEHEGLIRLFNEVVKDFKCKLILLGDGELRDYIINLAKNEFELKVSEMDKPASFNSNADLFVIGYTKNPFKYIVNADLYINSSSWEGFPNALTEAMVCGTPIISTDCPTGPREILKFDIDPGAPVTKNTLRNNNGSLMPLLNIYNNDIFNLWKKEIIWYLTDQSRSKTVKLNIQNTILKYDSSIVIKSWIDLINQD